MINLINVSKEFATSNGPLEVLKNINLTIEEGEIFGIIGLSGAGKSTLIRCINYLEKPKQGEVIFDGVALGSCTSADLRIIRQSMGMIFQNFNLLSQRNALNNVCFPLEVAGVPRAEAQTRAIALLKLVGLEDKLKAYPSQLSGGQKQRVAIARALATNPKVLLCDEVTSALDPETTRSILELLQDINQKLKVTIIMVTHEMQVVKKICQRIAVINETQIVEIGEVTEIFRKPKSAIARKLILSKPTEIALLPGQRCIRLIFDGNSAFEPLITQMAIESGVPVSILYANTNTIDSKVYGEMLLQLPEKESDAAKVYWYLDAKHIDYKKEEFDAVAADV
ncbi:MAG: ATP-binding cassette domain-containing protein [Erysipelotrichaceae bacterium]|nr:ATP-binding cassette domain-containing protein [Erysipelotrichaceae bacterium]